MRPAELVPAPGPVADVVRDALGRAHFERYTAATGLDRTWESVSAVGRDDWARPVQYLLPMVVDLVERARRERNARARWAVGSTDVTVSQQPSTSWCGDGCGPWVCSRPVGHDAAHAAGDGATIRAAWVGAL